jgi:acetylornithine deacetylase/succinyl-diaminopimelate desuccinylase-like protein
MVDAAVVHAVVSGEWVVNRKKYDDMLDAAVAHAHANQRRYFGQLCDFLRIPSISTLPAHRPDIYRAATWLAADMARIGLDNVQVIETAGHPVVYGGWLAAGPAAPTVLLYGHYDVQPVDPLELWQSPPFEPTIRDGLVFARGASDNKAQMFSHLKALESTLAANGRLPINVKVCFDGEEEVGSPNLEPFVAVHKALLAADSILISDGAMMGPDQPSIDYALRGVVSAEIRVTGPRRDLHSGSYGGTVHNPAQALAEIIAALHDADGRVTIPGFYDKVAPLSDAERELLRQASYTLDQWQAETGAPRPWGEPAYTLLERITARPTCEVNGIWSGFQGQGSKTIIPAEAGAKISLRLVAEQDPDETARLLADYVLSLTPDTVQVTVDLQPGARAAVTPFDSPTIAAASKAYEVAWGARPILSRAGGSLPIIAAMQRELGIPFVLMPFGLDDNRHSPNEHYRLDNFYRGIDTAIHYYHYLPDLA